MTTSPDAFSARLPRLHLVTDDATLARVSFSATAAVLCREGGASIAVHLRAQALPSRRLWEIATLCRAELTRGGGMLIINDRLDIARACSADGVQLGSRSFSPAEAGPLLDARVVIGRSVHSADEAAAARKDGADFVLAGTVFQSGSHPGRAGKGTKWLREIVDMGGPVVAIGGIRPRNVRSVMESGAAGIAVVSGVWSARDPIRALWMYLTQLESS